MSWHHGNPSFNNLSSSQVDGSAHPCPAYLAGTDKCCEHGFANTCPGESGTCPGNYHNFAWTLCGGSSPSTPCTSADCSNRGSASGNRPNCSCVCQGGWTGNDCSVPNIPPVPCTPGDEYAWCEDPNDIYGGWACPASGNCNDGHPALRAGAGPGTACPRSLAGTSSCCEAGLPTTCAGQSGTCPQNNHNFAWTKCPSSQIKGKDVACLYQSNPPEFCPNPAGYNGPEKPCPSTKNCKDAVYEGMSLRSGAGPGTACPRSLAGTSSCCEAGFPNTCAGQSGTCPQNNHNFAWTKCPSSQIKGKDVACLYQSNPPEFCPNPAGYNGPEKACPSTRNCKDAVYP